MNREFLATRWSMVAEAAAAEGRNALAELCETYYGPLLAYVRRRGFDEDAAQDMTQSFFAELIQRNWVADADGERGRFRTFLLTAMQRHLLKDYRSRSAEKRGGRWTTVELDAVPGECLSADLSPEREYDRQWALHVLNRAMKRVEAEAMTAGRAERFHALKPFLAGDAEAGQYAKAGAVLRLQPQALAQAVLRLRQRYKEAVRSEIAETVNDPALVEDELESLRAALRG